MTASLLITMNHMRLVASNVLNIVQKNSLMLIPKSVYRKFKV